MTSPQASEPESFTNRSTQILGSRYLALCPRPTEPIVAAELRALPEVTEVEVGVGVVSFAGPRSALYRANLQLRCASRVLFRLIDAPCTGPDELYAAAYALPWEDFLTPDGTLAVSAHGTGPGLSNSMFAALRVKDAVCDRFRARFGRRPNVDVQQPMLRINVQLYENRVTRARSEPRVAISLDSSDPPLYQRGYRMDATSAPLKETLAAAIVNLASQRIAPTGPLPPIVDLCCGSGTLLIEAGQLLLGRAAGAKRNFGFMHWRDFDAPLWRRLVDQSIRRERKSTTPFLFGSDVDRRAILIARRNLSAAGLANVADVRSGDLRQAAPPAGFDKPGIVICNPPYGERMGAGEDGSAGLSDLYAAIGETLKQRFTGYTAYVFTGNPDMVRPIGLRPSARHILFNGPIEARLLEFQLY